LRKIINRISILATICFLMLVISILLVLTQPVAEAQDEADKSMASLFQELIDDVIDVGGEITIHFSSPVAGIVTELRIPFDLTDNGEPRYSIVDVGQDYMCYRDNTGEVYFVFCVPFSNIASIGYTEVP
jgi:hypothetical protein